MTKPKLPKACAYCGDVRNLTRDHVIPRCLFPRPLPAAMLTVPACRSCNQRKAKHDDFLRDVLVTDIAAEDNAAAQAVFENVNAHLELTHFVPSRIDPPGLEWVNETIVSA